MFIKKIKQCELYPDRHLVIFHDDSTAFVRDVKVLEAARKFKAARVNAEITESKDKATGLFWVTQMTATV